MSENKTGRKTGKLAVISGFSGAGKGTLMDRLVAEKKDYVLSISMTTRKPRKGETDGVSYFFVSKEEFLKKLENDEILEHNVYNGNYYGTPRDFVDRNLREGRNVLLEIDVNGGEQILRKYPEAVLIFVVTPSAKVLEQRLTGRGTEKPQAVTQRLGVALEEIKKIPEYRYLIVNDSLEEAVREIDRLIREEPEESVSDKEREQFTDRFARELREIIARRSENVLK